MRALNLAVRFIAELLAVGFVAAWGYSLATNQVARVAMALVAAALLVTAWGTILAPRARSGLTGPQRTAIGTLVLLAAAGGLAVVGQPVAAAAFSAVVVVNAAALLATGPGPADRSRHS